MPLLGSRVFNRPPWRKTAAYRVLNETTTGEMYRAALARIFLALLPDRTGVSEDAFDLMKLIVHLGRSGFAVGINRSGGAGPPRGVAMADITDGTSNTILLVEARESVAWTRPGSDLAFDDGPNPNAEKLTAILAKLGGHAERGFNALLCDGSVLFIPSNVAVAVLLGLITRAAGEVISTDSF